MNKQTKQSIIITLLIAVFALVAAYFLWQPGYQESPTTDGQPTEETPVSVQAEYDEKLVYEMNPDIAEERYANDCSSRGGSFNACGSGCAPDSEICTTQCVYVCELTNSEQQVQGATTHSWSTYTSLSGGYTVSYPAYMDVETPNTTETDIIISKWGPTQEPNTELYDGVSMSFGQVLYSGSLETFVQNEVDNLAEISTVVNPPTELMIGGKVAHRYTVDSLGEHSYTYIPLSDVKALKINHRVHDPTDQGYAADVENIFASITVENGTEVK